MITAPKVRLAFASFFWKMTLCLVVAGEAGLLIFVWPHLDPLAGLPDRLAILAFLSVGFVLMPAIPIACLAAIMADLLVVVVVRPVAHAWHSPRSDASRVHFHLEAGELVIASTPARRADVRRGAVGSLVMTDRRLWFFPEGWDLPPWSADLGSVWAIRPISAPPMFWGLVRGWPRRVSVDAGPPRPITLVVPDPDGVCSWPKPNWTRR